MQRLLSLFLIITMVCIHSIGARAQLAFDARTQWDASTCASSMVYQTSIRAVNQLGELELSDGRTLNLVGLDFKKNDQKRAVIEAQLHTIIALQSLVRVYMWHKEPDRWGRTLGDVVIPLGESTASLSAMMIDGDFAFVQPNPALSTLCIHALKSIEVQARAAKRGVWAHDDWLLHASQNFNSTDVSRFEGTFAIMEGRVHSVGVRKNATYLNFGVFGSQALTVVIAPRIWLALEEQGLNRKRLKNAKVQVRGVLEKRRTLTMRIHHVEDVDILGD